MTGADPAVATSDKAKGAGRRSTVRRMLAHAALALGYALCYELLREVSVSHWNLPTGLRVLCLLLAPYRYWPAMIVGEALALARHGWAHHDEFGWLWAAMITLPPLLFAAPLFAALRDRLRIHRAGRVDVRALLTYVLIGATVNALLNTMTLAMVQMPPGETAPAVTLHIVLDYFLGSFLGALTLAPAVLALWKPGASAADVRRALLQRGLARDLAIGAVPSLVLLGGLASHAGSADMAEVARIAVFLPVAWMTLRHGWRGAAVAGTLASVTVQLTVTVVRDPAVIQAQALVAFALSTLLMLGERLQARAKDGKPAAPGMDEALRGFQLAQRGLYQEEQRLRHVADALDRLGESMLAGQARMMDRLRPVLPPSAEQAYASQLDQAQREVQRLADALHPRSWRQQGLAATFAEGPLAQAAALAGVGYACEFAGSGLNLLSPDVHMMLYRQACEVLVYLLAREPVKRVRVQIRGGCTRGRRWVVLRMAASRAPVSQRGRSAPEWRQLVALLGTNGQGMATVRERASIYGGTVHEREDDACLAVSLLLHDALRLEPSQVPLAGAQPLAVPG